MTLSMDVAGNARASLSRRLAEHHVRSRPGAPSLRYYDLTATDATGRTLHSWLTLSAGDTVLCTSTPPGARYPLTSIR